MARATDQMLTRYVAEIEERQSFIDGIVAAAQENSDDLSDDQLELVTRARDRIATVNRLMLPLEESRRISDESSARIQALARFMNQPDAPTEVEYRSAGAYVADCWQARLGMEEASRRLEVFHRAAAHQTVADNPGVIPDPIVGPVVNFVDAQRPLVTALGPRQLPSATWSRPKVTQHTAVGAQTTEKSELVSQKMLIVKLPASAKTYGGYVNVSRQDIDWSQPSVLDLVINDLAAQYAITTESAAGAYFNTNSTAGPTLPTGANTAADISGAIWTAAGSVWAATKGAGRVVMFAPPGMLGLIGPVFAPVNPQNAQSTGFNAGDFAAGLVGSISGIPIYITTGLPANTMLVMSTAAGEVYEDRIGSLQVVEPSVIGVQVAYAGYFTPLAIEPAGIIKITKTP